MDDSEQQHGLLADDDAVVDAAAQQSLRYAGEHQSERPPHPPPVAHSPDEHSLHDAESGVADIQDRFGRLRQEYLDNTALQLSQSDHVRQIALANGEFRQVLPEVGCRGPVQQDTFAGAARGEEHAIPVDCEQLPHTLQLLRGQHYLKLQRQVAGPGGLPEHSHLLAASAACGRQSHLLHHLRLLNR